MDYIRIRLLKLRVSTNIYRMHNMKTIIVGSRSITDYNVLLEALKTYQLPITEIISKREFFDFEERMHRIDGQ